MGDYRYVPFFGYHNRTRVTICSHLHFLPVQFSLYACATLLNLTFANAIADLVGNYMRIVNTE